MKQIPKWVIKEVNTAYRGTRSTWHDSFFIVRNTKLQTWLGNNVAVTTDSGITDFGIFKSRFDWISQSFLISA